MIIIAREGDEFQSIQVKEAIEQLEHVGIPRVIYPKHRDDVSFLQYRTFEEDRLVIIHTNHTGYIADVFKADFDFWDVILYVEKLGSVTSYIRSDLQSKLVKIVPVFQYEDKKIFFESRLTGYKFERGVKNVLLRLLVRTPSDYDSVKLYLEGWERDKPITLEDVQYVVGDSDIYNLDECLLNIIYGTGKQKTSWMLDYFIHKREYHPIWLYRKLVEMVLSIGYVYNLYKEGVILAPLSESDYLKRVAVAGIKPKERWLSYRTQQTILTNIAKETSQQYAKRSRVILVTQVTDEDGLYELMVRLQNYGA